MLSSTSSEHVQVLKEGTEADDGTVLPHVGAWPEPGRTPLVRDGGDRWLKLESLQPSGHVTDRIAGPAIIGSLAKAGVRAGEARLLVASLGPLAISVAQHAVTAGVNVTVLYRSIRPELRLRALAVELGAQLQKIGETESRNTAVKAWLAKNDNGVLVSETHVGLEPGRKLALELVQQLGDAPCAVVVSQEAEALAAGVNDELGEGVCLVMPEPTPTDQEIQAVKLSLGRQGVLVGPTGAAVALRARQLTVENPEASIVAVLPDGGHRHLGWWPGWGLRSKKSDTTKARQTGT